jgi:hypothetical protein
MTQALMFNEKTISLAIADAVQCHRGGVVVVGTDKCVAMRLANEIKAAYEQKGCSATIANRVAGDRRGAEIIVHESIATYNGSAQAIVALRTHGYATSRVLAAEFYETDPDHFLSIDQKMGEAIIITDMKPQVRFRFDLCA